MIRVLIVDDEILARVGIQSLLENSQEIQVVGSFNLASEALEFLKTTIVDIIITAPYGRTGVYPADQRTESCTGRDYLKLL